MSLGLLSRLCGKRVDLSGIISAGSVGRYFRAAVTTVFIMLLGLTHAGSAGAFSEMIVFGDSLSDSGNVYIASNGTIPAPPYYEGRFSNGLNYADHLASLLGLKLEPALAGGTNYAYGGARIESTDSTPEGLLAQISIFRLELALGLIDRPDSDALYVVFIGQNDMFDTIDDAVADPLNQAAIIAEDVASAVSGIQDGLSQLRNEGAVNFLIPNLPNLGRTPKLIREERSTQGTLAAARTVSEAYNQALASMCASLAGVNIVLVDIYGALEQVANNPFAYGLADVASACYTGDEDYTGGGTVCSTPGSYLFWDEIHPSAAAHALFGELVRQTIAVREGLVAGDFNGDGRDDLAALTSAGKVYYTLDLASWQNIAGTLNQLIAGDFNGDGRADLAGLTSSGQIYYTVDLANWQYVPGTLNQLAAGDFNGDGRADLAGLTASGSIFYTVDCAAWTNIPGTVSRLVVGNFDADAADELAGLTYAGQIYYTLDLLTWQQIPGVLNQLTAGDFNGDGVDDLAGLTASGSIFYTVDCAAWTNIPGTLAQLVVGNFDSDAADELAGLTADGQVFYTVSFPNWVNIPGTLNQLAAADLSGTGPVHNALAGTTAAEEVFYTLDLSTWSAIPAPR